MVEVVMTEEIAAVPAAESAGYGDAVTDEEFEDWVKRSQADTDAALGDWDNSVHFDQIRSMVPPPMEVDAQDDGWEEPPGPNHDPATCPTCIYIGGIDPITGEQVPRPARVGYASMAERIRAGQELGPEDRARVVDDMASLGPVVERLVRQQVGLPTVEVEFLNMQCDDPARECRRVESMPSWPSALATEEMVRRVRATGYLVDPFAEEIARRRRAHVAQQNLERMGFVVVDDTAGPRLSGLVLPFDDDVAWAKREFGVIPPAEIAPGYTWTRG
jgi:hypothetical protein